MKKIFRPASILALSLLLISSLGLSLAGCGKSGLSEEEQAAFAAMFEDEQLALTNITDEVLTGERAEKFTALRQVYTTPEGDWAVVSAPIGYNGPLTLAVAIDAASGSTIGLRIVEHMETQDYVRDIESGWFIDRFAQKSAAHYLKVVKLNAYQENEIVAITGATVTTEAIANGVNAALGLFREAVWGETAEAVPYKVIFNANDGSELKETGAIAIRAYGVVIGEVTMEELQAMPSVLRAMTVHSSSGDTEHSYRGTLLSNVLDTVDPELKNEYDSVEAIGIDSYMANINMDEVRMENNVYIMYEDNGEPLPKRDGSPGGLRIVVLDDFFGQRFTNYLLEIVLEKENL